jgi:mannose/fructose-specific phosphotransferase system component IIA
MSDETKNPTIPTNVVHISEAVTASSVETTSQQPESVVSETPAVEQTDGSPKSVSELVARVDLNGVSVHDVVVDLIAGIQQLGVRATIALGLLERLKVEELKKNAVGETIANTTETSSESFTETPASPAESDQAVS